MTIAAERVTTAELLRAAIEDRLIDLHTAMPAKVEKYDNSTQTVDVVPCLNRALPDGAGNYITEALPKLQSVPVAFPRAGGFFVSFPIQAGDYVLLVFSERNIGAWRSTGNQGDPGDIGTHVLDGAIAIPGVFPDSQALSNSSGSNMVLGKDGTPNSQIVIKPTGEIDLGANSTQFVALANLVFSELQAIQNALLFHKHGGVTTGTGTSLGSDSAYAPSSVAASAVKAT